MLNPEEAEPPLLTPRPPPTSPPPFCPVPLEATPPAPVDPVKPLVAPLLPHDATATTIAVTYAIKAQKYRMARG
jgi:hypothetical protein